jgi:hypothetical protein
LGRGSGAIAAARVDRTCGIEPGGRGTNSSNGLPALVRTGAANADPQPRQTRTAQNATTVFMSRLLWRSAPCIAVESANQ